MFILLTRILLWLLVLTIIWYVFTQFIPRPYLTWLGAIILLFFIVMAFSQPGNPAIGAVWGLISFPLKPLGLAIFLFLSSLKAGIAKVDGKLMLAGLLVLILSSLPIVAFWLTQQTGTLAINSSASFQPNPAQVTVRAIAVMGDGSSATDPLQRSRSQFNTASTYLTNQQISRLVSAANLYQARVAQSPNLIVIASAGAAAANDSQDPAATLARTTLNQAGVPNERIFIAASSEDIYTSAVAIRSILAEQGYQPQSESVILVAPAISIGRASATLRQLGVQVVPEPTDSYIFQLTGRGERLLAHLADIIPSADALVLTTRVVEELLTSVYYFLRGWIGGTVF